MGVFDKIQSQAAQAAQPVGQAAAGPGQHAGMSASVVFADIPENVDQMAALPQAALASPADTAALFVTALCVYPLSKDDCVAMINFLKGPAQLSNMDISFLSDRMRQNGKAPYLGASYFHGASPDNEYTPSQPYTIYVADNPYSYDNQGYVKLFVKSAGGDSPRGITMRQAKDGKWYLWEYSTLLTDIRPPESTNPWA